ncbi:FAD binding domain protein [Apiospora marii]|uniref:FAD binding domain protein n=1 Tax=Apiospora marii TaxID=335849 RepID=A0ABR1R5D2_9PEZI
MRPIQESVKDPGTTRNPGGEDGRGTLKIADFGQAELHEWHCKTRKRSEVADTMAYRAPECHFDGKRFRQSSDVWSLGCLFLVFVAWTLGGEELVSKFASDRSAFDQYWGISSDTFFQIDRLADDAEAWSVMVKPAVVQFIHQLRSHPKCSDYIHNLLDLIYTKMLVIESKSSERRMACIHVHRELKIMRERCCADAYYATAGNPWAAPRDMPVPSAPVQVRPPNAMMMVPIAEKKMQSAVNGGVKKKVSFGVTRYQCLLTRAQTG